MVPVSNGKTTDDIDKLVHKLAIDNEAYPSPLHYKGFPKSVCTSVNNVACHGIPDDRPLEDGDIINIDVTKICVSISDNSYPGRMLPGMTFTIEPVIAQGSENIVILEDGWTAVTEDTGRAAQFEHTVLITETGVEVLTQC
uniref:Peptidase M24 domain-containing protein n=1 Tax=Timema genevievae TaxID=629358 RepID=A0A7R9PH34_TIMGE|nr:unnamed protein product [Timema genevievae]